MSDKKNDKSVINKDVFKGNIIIRRNFVGKEMMPDEAGVFQEVLNRRRPYCRTDFEPQSFLPDLSRIR